MSEIHEPPPQPQRITVPIRITPPILQVMSAQLPLRNPTPAGKHPQPSLNQPTYRDPRPLLPTMPESLHSAAHAVTRIPR
jgi:hypothetical protein